MSKFKNGLLLIQNQRNLYQVINEGGKLISNSLYIGFNLNRPDLLTRNDYFELAKAVYSRPLDVCRHLDLHVLLPGKQDSFGSVVKTARRTFSALDVCIVENGLSMPSEDYIKKNVELVFGVQNCAVNFLNVNVDAKAVDIDERGDCHQQYPSYSGVVIGGTFDHFHDGHKLLLATALLLADDKLTVGVADGVLLEKKVLKELIEPVERRIKNVIDHMEVYRPGLQHKVVPIYDPCGPSGTDDDLQLLVVSEETMKGGPVVNSQRKENGLAGLEVFNIHLVGESPTDLSESFKSEGKLSSSAERVRELGTLRMPPNHGKNNDGLYVIGVAGGIASGKSSMVKRLKKLGAYTVDCDLLGHEAYKPGMPAYHDIIKEFGEDLINPDDKTIIRRKLGAIVFSDPSKLKLLNSIVWPEIHRMKQEKIAELSRQRKYRVVFFEGAVLFEAGWDKEPHEIWCCVIPKEEAVKRIMNRNGLSEEEAWKRVKSQQMTNEERVNRSHVVLSTLWEPEFSQKQCEKAWKLLNERIDNLS